MNEWEFNGQMNCDKCKFKEKCLSLEENCPYIAGWQDGQAKLLMHLKKGELPQNWRSRELK